MRKMLVLGALLVSALAVFAQQPRPPMPRHLPPPPPRPGFGTPFIEKFILCPSFCEANAITTNQIAAIRAGLKAIDAQCQKLESQIAAEAKEQGNLVKAVLSGASTNTAALDAIIEKIGLDRTEQAKLTTRRLLVMRDTLTEAQRKSVVKKLMQEHERRRQLIENRRQELDRTPPQP